MLIQNNFNEDKNLTKKNSKVIFNRKEIGLILRIYGRMVSIGHWRDYGISMLKEVAIFSIYRHTSEHPIYRIVKKPYFARKQGMYSVIEFDGRILKQGNDLSIVLKVFENKLIRIIR